MATFQELYQEIEPEVRESSLGLITGQVKQAINDAIAFYEFEPFAFNQAVDTSITTADGAESYPLPPRTLVVQHAEISWGGANLRRMTERSFEWYRRATEGAEVKGTPSVYYALYDDRIWLYPTPNGAYPITLYVIERLAEVPLAADADQNAWTNDARPLIKARAKYLLYAHTVQNPSWAEVMALEEQSQLRNLRAKYGKRLSGRCLEPAVF